jgi:hypothetical protein
VELDVVVWIVLLGAELVVVRVLEDEELLLSQNISNFAKYIINIRTLSATCGS